MADFSYSPSAPTSLRDQLRFLVGDTDDSVTTGPRAERSYYLSDGELDMVIARCGSDLNAAAEMCCRHMAGTVLCQVVAVRLGVFATTTEAAEKWEARADKFHANAASEAGMAWAEIGWDETVEAEIDVDKTLRGDTD